LGTLAGAIFWGEPKTIPAKYIFETNVIFIVLRRAKMKTLKQCFKERFLPRMFGLLLHDG